MTRKIVLLVIVILSQTTIFGQKVLWQFKTNDRVYTSAYIEDQILYFGSGDGNFYAIDKNTGAKIWAYKTDGPIHSSASGNENILYFGSSDGNLYALEKTNGELIWKFSSNGEKVYDLWDYYLSSPKVDQADVYWGSGDGHVYSLNGKKGDLKWKFKTKDVVHASPIINNKTVYVGSFDGIFYALNKNNGKVKWSFDTKGETYFPKGEVQRAAYFNENLIYFGSRDYNLYALDALSGEEKWTVKDEGGWIIATPIAYKGLLYFGTSDGHVFYAVDKKTGEIKWKAKVPMRVYGSAIAYRDRIYFGCFDGKLLGLNYETGKIEWEFQTELSKKNYGKIYDENGHFKEGFQLYGEDYIKTEANIHELGSILSTPVIQDGVVYFGSSDGFFYAVSIN